jgi:hypothetical protein
MGIDIKTAQRADWIIAFLNATLSSTDEESPGSKTWRYVRHCNTKPKTTKDRIIVRAANNSFLVIVKRGGPMIQ